MATPSVASLNNQNGSSFNVPLHDHQEFTYVAAGAADNDDVETIVYKLGGASGKTVATLTFTYVGSTNNVESATLSVP